MKFEIKKIVDLRASKHISVKKFAELLGISTRTVYNWESGVSQPGKSDLMAIAYLFNINLSDISEFKNPGFHYTKPGLLKNNGIKESTKLLKEIINDYHFGDNSKLLPLLKSEEEITRLTEENCRLNEKNSTLLHYLNLIDTAVYIKNSNRVITYVNNAFLNLLADSIKENNIIGYKFTDIFRDNQCFSIIKYENEAFAGANINNIPVLFPVKGKSAKCLISIKPVYLRDGKIQQIISTINYCYE